MCIRDRGWDGWRAGCGCRHRNARDHRAVVVAIPLKIWNASRIEIKLKEQKRLVLEARFDALQRQINPHFLFNTLNSCLLYTSRCV